MPDSMRTGAKRFRRRKKSRQRRFQRGEIAVEINLSRCQAARRCLNSKTRMRAANIRKQAGKMPNSSTSRIHPCPFPW